MPQTVKTVEYSKALKILEVPVTDRYFLSLPLGEPGVFQAACERKSLSPVVVSFLTTLAVTGRGDARLLIKRQDLPVESLIRLVRGRNFDPILAEEVFKHPNFNLSVLSEITIAGLKQKEDTRVSSVLNAMREGNTIVRCAVMLVDQDVVSTPQEVLMLLEAINQDHEKMRLFMTLVQGWVGSVTDLLRACDELVDNW